MDSVHLSNGILMIVLGFLVKAFPLLIAGYNTMPKEKKKNVDISGLSKFMRNCLIVMGFSVIAINYLFHYFNLPSVANMTIIIVTGTGLIVMLSGAQRFNKN